jgi:hypothetical protein
MGITIQQNEVDVNSKQNIQLKNLIANNANACAVPNAARRKRLAIEI